MNVKEKDLVTKALGLAEKVGERIESGYWLAEGKTPGPLPSSANTASRAVYAKGIWLVPDGRYYYRAEEGGTWERKTLPEGMGAGSIKYGNRMFLTYSNGNSKVCVSSDGLNFSIADLPASHSNGIAMFAQGKFWIFGTSKAQERAKTCSSQDGVTWTTVGSSGLYSSNTVGADGFSYDEDVNKFYAICADQVIYKSDDGINWSVFKDLSSYSSIKGLAAGGGYVAIATYGPYTSSAALIIYDESGNSIARFSGEYFNDARFFDSGKFINISNSEPASIYIVDPAAKTINSVATLQGGSGSGRWITKTGNVYMAFVSGKTYYAHMYSVWSQNLDCIMTNSTGTDKTTEVLNALNGIQTNTLDAAYTNGVNAYQGE